MICSFECTFCTDCVERLLANVCPNCGGGFTPRPVRPVRDWNDGNCIANYPPAATAPHHPVDLDAHAALRARLGDIAPEQR